ncbi:TetR/AcrR family transcriptional regulator [Bacillus aquiflavi]|uniref:TetR/AcrR family transcriptional regulator n=1 Tax=Bacillus aquiflavi TaxID=2672567 RepID=A0A6B3VT40_9BACI|nr:TetR/AcrR family transcriptional regulator [Bacillus aquiflavi]MBA4536782.1 TetR/AcrR family transcriptional regulator [Bacillus aquiflavi]NEY81149.1 TetR/AcrR family transcriptional regulator [Bacillus aquiflavi]UAC49710.1 TetR/AcrR family transcriptional regulator [Bacillus aquiflavi]
MIEQKTDPRIIRTRKLIMDAFIQLSMKKDFKDITIKDITAKATVNRATFYYHFADKYDLLEKVLSEDLMLNFCSEIAEHDELNQETIISVFLSVTHFQISLSTKCPRSFKAFTETIEAIIKKRLENLFYQMLTKEQSTSTDRDCSLRIAAVMLSWGIYGASVDWQHNRTMSPEEYIKLALPYVTHGMNYLVSDKWHYNN